MSSSSLTWNSPLSKLIAGRKSKTVDKLVNNGVDHVKDLLWILPLRTTILPKVQSFHALAPESLFKGVAKAVAFRDQPNFKARGKGRTPLSNVTVTVQDRFSEGMMNLKWFNCYPSQVKKLKEQEYLFFTGSVSEFMGEAQMISPDVEELTSLDYEKDLKEWQDNDKEAIKVTYPTVDGISPHHLAGLFDKIPHELWETIEEPLPKDMIEKRNLISLKEAFSILHGKIPPHQLTPQNLDKAQERLIYHEFFTEQIKIKLRREILKGKPSIHLNDENWREHLSLFPYQLTEDQEAAINDILKDFQADRPMMRLIQGDVGSGKTSVALISALIAISQGYQAAIMCPTEALALQHFLTFKELLKGKWTLDILLGSQSKKDKELVLAGLSSGKTQIVIGTHSLIQESVSFKNLAFCVIDEQHKFGVDQRLKLVNKSEGCHCLLMTATPIPRSLSLTQYGDLDISIIKQMPSNRKGTQTRIVAPENYAKYLSFLKTRVSMGEQAYVVVPAIEENPEQDMLNLEVVLKKYREYFPEFRIEGLHGKMKSDEKNKIFISFREKEIDIMISTSVIEVGINNPNATVMTILNPERFGLSSLHQMRGRVGRGEKPGFCFLVNDKPLSPTSMERLSVIEKSSDGFIIAEEDLKIRGEGDLFGRDQSGVKSTRVLSSLIHHQDTLEKAKEDVISLCENHPDLFSNISLEYKSDDLVGKTV